MMYLNKMRISSLVNNFFERIVLVREVHEEVSMGVIELVVLVSIAWVVKVWLVQRLVFANARFCVTSEVVIALSLIHI